MRFFDMSSFCLSWSWGCAHIGLDGLDVSNIAAVCEKSENVLKTISHVCCLRRDAIQFDFKLLYSFSFADRTFRPIPDNIDLRFKSFLVLVEIKEDRIYILDYPVKQTTLRNFEDEEEPENISALIDFFPLQFVDDHGEDVVIAFQCGDQYDYQRVEIYEFRPNFD
jgi:hypothetical protein